MSITQDNVHAILCWITPQIIQRLADENALTLDAAAAALYTSRLYATLEREDTKLWHLSSLALTDLLQQELATGVIRWPQEV